MTLANMKPERGKLIYMYLFHANRGYTVHGIRLCFTTVPIIAVLKGS